MHAQAMQLHQGLRLTVAGSPASTCPALHRPGGIIMVGGELNHFVEPDLNAPNHEHTHHGLGLDSACVCGRVLRSMLG